ncbi:efflux RND transporter permease subunit [Desulfosediminicola ganghwensis]|uniref:efflux RND transporter permease subunit n=1 Tax=Desulfosediminicola ganghwensis TaxID=2569540 RepID=UPI0010ACE7FD|nr:efflux RND transporter permease subunit [Desulfosediminicola ganghwensis]
MSRFFIERPKFAWVVAIFIAMAGLLAIPNLPVERYPQVAPPQISVGVFYPGASAETLNDSVIGLIEEEINGADGLLYFESTSNSNGSGEITITFGPGTDADMAQVDIQNRIRRAEPRLPEVVRNQGINVDKASAGFLMVYALNYHEGAQDTNVQRLADYAARNINNDIRRIPGVGRVQFFTSESAMRVWLDPQKLISYNLSVTDISQAIASQNIQVPAGSFGDRPSPTSQELTATLMVDGTMITPEEFGNIVLISKDDGSAVHLRDVSRIEIGPESYNISSRVNSIGGAVAAVQLAPGANAIATADAIKERLEELSKNFPDDIQYSIPYDTSKFVKVAIEKVIYTLLEAVLLVFLVMFLFLQNFRYTIIPTIVVPICLLGTFALMEVLGFSINMMTMFGMVLAIGILVDDAIVVVENVERIMAEEGLSPREATIQAMKQISGAIVGITLVLAAVFFPLAFMDGSVGVIYQQFSISLAISIIFSGFLALSLTPALCATMLKPISGNHGEEKGGFFGMFNRSFNRLTNGYVGLTNGLVRRTGRVMIIYAVILGALGYTYLRMPESFVPDEDQGLALVNVQLPAGATYNRTLEVMENVEKFFLSQPEVLNVVSINGFSFSGQGQNAGLAFVELKDWSERSKEQSVANLIAKANGYFFTTNKDGMVFSVNPPAVDGLGAMGGFSLRVLDYNGTDRAEFRSTLNTLLQEANSSSIVRQSRIEGLPDAPQLRLDIDRQKAEVLGVDFSAIRTVLSTSYGSATINEFVRDGRVQRVVVQAGGEHRLTPESLDQLYVQNRMGEDVPLKSFVSTSWETGPVQFNRYNGFDAFKVAGDAQVGSSSGQAMIEMERIVDLLPTWVGSEWTGLSYQEKLAGDQALYLFALALLIVFLLLVALYESWAIPFSVMLIVPIGAIGAVLATMVLQMENDVYFKVGLITIIGLSAKNAILIVEFAKDLYAQGQGLLEATVTASKLRFRPIIMTSMAFTLGVVPLATSTGAGSASQRAIGTGVIGGMTSATIFGVLFIPVLFVFVLKVFGIDRKKQEAIANTESSQATLPEAETAKGAE